MSQFVTSHNNFMVSLVVTIQILTHIPHLNRHALFA
jgi:hypothetical protein